MAKLEQEPAKRERAVTMSSKGKVKKENFFWGKHNDDATRAYRYGFYFMQAFILTMFMIIMGAIFSGTQTSKLELDHFLPWALLFYPILFAVFELIVVDMLIGREKSMHIIKPLAVMHVVTIILYLILGWTYLIDPTQADLVALVVRGFARPLILYWVVMKKKSLGGDDLYQFRVVFVLLTTFLVNVIMETIMNAFFFAQSATTSPIVIIVLLAGQRLVVMGLMFYGNYLAGTTRAFSGGAHNSHIVVVLIDSFTVVFARIFQLTVPNTGDMIQVAVAGAIGEIVTRFALLSKMKVILKYHEMRKKGDFIGPDGKLDKDAWWAANIQEKVMKMHHGRTRMVSEFATIVGAPVLITLWNAQHCPNVSLSRSCGVSDGQLFLNMVILLVLKLFSEGTSQYFVRKTGIRISNSYNKIKWKTFPAQAVTLMYAVVQLYMMAYNDSGNNAGTVQWQAHPSHDTAVQQAVATVLYPVSVLLAIILALYTGLKVRSEKAKQVADGTYDMGDHQSIKDAGDVTNPTDETDIPINVASSDSEQGIKQVEEPVQEIDETEDNEELNKVDVVQDKKDDKKEQDNESESESEADLSEEEQEQ